MDNYLDFGSTKPILTEPGVKYFLDQTLKQCHIIKRWLEYNPQYLKKSNTPPPPSD